MTNSTKALLYGLATVGIWSTVASAFKISLRHLDPIQLLLCACTVSLLVLGSILVVQGKITALRHLSARQYLFAAGMGVLNPFLYYIILFKAYDLLPAQEAQPLNYTWAITLSILSVPLLGQRLRFKEVVAILISYAGVLIISTHGQILSLNFSNPMGVTLALTSTIIWALYWIGNTKSTIDPIVGLFLNFSTALPLIFIATLVYSQMPTLTLEAVAGGAYVGLFEMGITFVLWLTAMKYAAKPDGGGTARIANLIFLSPFLSLILIHFLIGETILPSTFTGLGLIVIGNALMQYKRA